MAEPSPDGGNPVICLPPPSPHPWSTTDRNRHHSKETVELPYSLEVERYEVSPYDSNAGTTLMRQTRGPKSGTGDASVASVRRRLPRWLRKQIADADVTHVSEGRKPSVGPVRSLSRVLTETEIQVSSSAAKGLASLVAVVPERLSHAATATTSSCPTSAVYRLGGFAGLATTDPVYFSCTLPRSVRAGLAFQVRISAYLRPDLDEALGPTIVARMVNSSVPGISRGQRVMVKLDVPDNMFKVLGSSMDGFEKATKPSREKVCAEEENQWSFEEKRKSVRMSTRRSKLWTTTGARPDLEEIYADPQYKPKFSINPAFYSKHDVSSSSCRATFQDVPDNMFKVLGSSMDGFEKASKPPREKVCAEEENQRSFEEKRKSVRTSTQRSKLWTTTGARPDLKEIYADPQYKPKFSINSFFYSKHNDIPDTLSKALDTSVYSYDKAVSSARAGKDLAANLSKAVEPSKYDSDNLARTTGGGKDGLGLDVHHDIGLAANLSKAVEPSIHDPDNLARPTRGGKNDLGLDVHYDIDSAGNLSVDSDPAIPDSDEASPAVQDFVWNGSEQHATFTVMCLPDARANVVRCGASISEGGRAIHSSFHIKVGEAGGTRSIGDNVTAGELDSALEQVKPDVTMADPSGPTTSSYAPVRSMKRRLVLPLTSFILADRVDAGPSVHESKGHGFRLTVQEGSLHSAIGPITIQEFAQVVRCEDDGHDYLVKTTVGCLPSGIMFPDEPLLMDFMANETSRGKVSQHLQVLVRKDDDRGWRKIESQVRKDQWGTYVRAAVRDFCFFVCGRQIHPSDPARIENCDEKDMIEVQNATGVDLYLVLVPVSFSSDRTCHVTYTGSIGFGVAGLSFDAGVSSGHESVEKNYLLPAGLTPDEVSVPAGGTFHFEPPPDATRGKLLIATIAEDSQAGLSARVVVLHGKFITSIGKRRVILPSFLQSKSRITATLGPDDIPVNMVMIMAGLGSKAERSTVASTPENTFHLRTRSPLANVAPPSTVVSAAGPSTPTPRRNGAAPGCGVS